MSARREGPIEAGRWPTQLPARAISPGPAPRVFGYDLATDLAPNYRLPELAWLAVQGDLPPTEAQGRAFELALSHLFAVPAEAAPSHAAGLARRCGTKPGAVTAIAAVSLAEEAQRTLEGHEGLYRWLESGGEFPDEARGREEEREAVCALDEQLRGLGFTFEALFESRPSLVAAGLGVLFRLGLTDLERITTIWVWCRLPCAMAEALAGPRARLGDYPMNLPEVRYEGGDE